MASKFEDIEIWQQARFGVIDIYSLTGEERIRKQFSLVEQIQRMA
jgi:hypothetical protein